MNLLNKVLVSFGLKPKEPKEKKPKYRYRHAGTGKLLTKEEYDKLPKENTVREKIKYNKNKVT